MGINEGHLQGDRVRYFEYNSKLGAKAGFRSDSRGDKKDSILWLEPWPIF